MLICIAVLQVSELQSDVDLSADSMKQLTESLEEQMVRSLHMIVATYTLIVLI